MAIKKRTPESEVQKAVIECLKLWGLEPRRRNTGAAMNPSGRLVRFGQRGDPDLETTLPDGRLLQVEVKAPGKTPRPEQLDRLRLTNDQGAVGLWIDDAAELARLIPKLCDGWWVWIDPAGRQWLMSPDEPRPESCLF